MSHTKPKTHGQVKFRQDRYSLCKRWIDAGMSTDKDVVTCRRCQDAMQKNPWFGQEPHVLTCQVADEIIKRLEEKRFTADDFAKLEAFAKELGIR